MLILKYDGKATQIRCSRCGDSYSTSDRVVWIIRRIERWLPRFHCTKCKQAVVREARNLDPVLDTVK